MPVQNKGDQERSQVQNRGEHGRSHIQFSQHTRSLPNKLKQRTRRRQGGDAGETDAYCDFLEKKQGQMDMWGETFREHFR